MAKTLFSDFKFIDLVVQFCKEPEKGLNTDNEADYKVYVSQERLNMLIEVVHKLPLITSKDMNVSSSMYMII